MADQGGNCASVGGWGYEGVCFNGISVGMSGYCGLSFPLGENVVCAAPSDDIAACCHDRGTF